MQGTPQDGGILRRTLDVVFNSISEYQAKRCIFKPDGMNGFDGQLEAEAYYDRRRQDATPVPSRGTRTPRYRRDTSGSGSQDSSQRVPDTSRIEDIVEDNVYAIFVCYIEIYNNYIYDLLEELPEVGPIRSLQTKILREDAQHNMYVHACTEMEVKCPEDALEILYKGQKRRKIACTRLNCESSRSHSIFTIRVVQAPLDARGEEIITDKNTTVISQLSLVDLAGSERNLRTKAVGDRIKEAGNINNSLMTLRACIEALRENQILGLSKKVPYRDCKLTHYFKNYFDGDGSVKMVVCVNPKAEDYDETVPVMKFAELASEVQVQRSAHPRHDLGLGLLPGRRRMNQLFSEIGQRLEEEAAKREVVPDFIPVYASSPVWPSMAYTSTEEYGEMLNKMIAFTDKLVEYEEEMDIDLQDRIPKVRNALAELDKENAIAQKEVLSLRSLYNDAHAKNATLESMLLNAESVNESLHRKFADYNNLVDECNAVREQRDMAKSQGKIEKQRMKAKLKVKLDAEKEKLKNEMNIKLKEKQSKMYKTQVRALKEILLDDNKTSTPTSHLRSSDPDLNRGYTPNNSVVKSSSDPKLNATPSLYPNLRGPAVVNLRHRRSRSQGADVWLDHHPQAEVPLGTILQPDLKRRKSVTKVTSTDLQKDQITNYCLTTQDQDSDGGLETKLYKGSVLPTVGGGSQVVLNDVEILKQRDPLTVPGEKRSSDGTPKVDHSTVQDRCAVGIVGLSTPRPYLYKRQKL